MAGRMSDLVICYLADYFVYIFISSGTYIL
jgi:hypothetical protein